MRIDGTVASISFSPWFASSRVGASTMQRGRASRESPLVNRLSMMGREKPSVLPVPVLARPTTSRPSSAGASTFAWMSNSVSMPRFFSAALVISDRGKLSTCILSGLEPEWSGTAARRAGA